MDGVADELLISATSHMSGVQRRMFQAAVCLKLCDGNTRQAEYRFGWGRNTVAQGLEERKLNPEELASRKSGNAGKKRSEDRNPQLKIDIRLIVEPHTQTDPELKTDRRYTNLSAAEVRQALLDRDYSQADSGSRRPPLNRWFVFSFVDSQVACCRRYQIWARRMTRSA